MQQCSATVGANRANPESLERKVYYSGAREETLVCFNTSFHVNFKFAQKLRHKTKCKHIKNGSMFSIHLKHKNMLWLYTCVACVNVLYNLGMSCWIYSGQQLMQTFLIHILFYQDTRNVLKLLELHLNMTNKYLSKHAFHRLWFAPTNTCISGQFYLSDCHKDKLKVYFQSGASDDF